jgi:hypothetical protein
MGAKKRRRALAPEELNFQARIPSAAKADFRSCGFAVRLMPRPLKAIEFFRVL